MLLLTPDPGLVPVVWQLVSTRSTAAAYSSASEDPNILPMSLLACTTRSPNVWPYWVPFVAILVSHWVVVVAAPRQYDQSCSHAQAHPPRHATLGAVVCCPRSMAAN